MINEKSDSSDFNVLPDHDKIVNVNRNHVILRFFKFTFSPDIITNEMRLQPFQSGVKGEMYLPKGLKVEKMHESNNWSYELKTNSNEFIGDLVAKFIVEIIEPRVDLIKRFENCNVELSIVQYYYNGCNPGVYIEPHHNKILAEINSSINIDIYCLTE